MKANYCTDSGLRREALLSSLTHPPTTGAKPA